MRALIIGISGMDGSYMADLLLSKGYEVFGVKHRHTPAVKGEINILSGDLLSQESMLKCLNESAPDEVYNFAGQSSPFQSWMKPSHTCDVNGIGVVRILEAIREYGKPVKFFQASSCEMFGKTPAHTERCSETTPFNPQNPYGASKLFAHNMTVMYRKAYGMFNCSSIAYNHESERRSVEFLTRKITNGVAKIYLGLSDCITLGNLELVKDWGYAPEFVEAAWRIMQHDKPDDYVIATEQSYSIRDFIEFAFSSVGISEWRKYIRQDKKFMRPAETTFVLADCSKARNELGWKPEISFREMIKIMVQHDLDLLRIK